MSYILGNKGQEERVSGQDSRWEVWFRPEIPGLTQDACPAYAATGLPTQCLASVTGFLNVFFSVLLGCSVGSPEARGSMQSLSLCLGEEPEARFGWLETPGLLWGQRELVQGVKDDETAFAPTASFGVCCHHHGGLSMDLISEQPLPTAPRAGQDAERSVSLPSKQHWWGGLGEM